MTSVPKPLKILQDKFELLKETFEKMVGLAGHQWRLIASLSAGGDASSAPSPALRCSVSAGHHSGGQGETVPQVQTQWVWGEHQLIWPPLHQVTEGGRERLHSPPLSLSLCSRICTQVPAEWQMKASEAESSLLPLVHSIVVYCLDHSSESEAVDLLMEIDRVPLLKQLVKEDTYQRVCLYLTR